MKVIAVLVLVLVSLTGCLATTAGPTQAQVSSFWQDHRARLDLAKTGAVKRSDVFRESYAKMAAMPPGYDHHVFLWFFNEMIAIAVKHESGQISFEQALDLARSVEVETRQRSADAKVQYETLQAQKKSSDAARAAASAQIYQQWQATQPKPPAFVNCTTQRLGTMLSTQCY